MMPRDPIISPELEESLARLNPWWLGQPISRDLPTYKRWACNVALERLKHGMTRITSLIGPRQVGKSTVMLQIIAALLAEGVDPHHIIYIQFDDIPELIKLSEPILRLTEWVESRLGQTINQLVSEGRTIYLLLDEVQNVEAWAPQLKFLVDTTAVRVMVTGSSSLEIERGRDSLAGRIQTLEMGPLLLREIMAIRGWGDLAPYLPFNGLAPLKELSFWHGLKQFGLDHREARQRAFSAFSERGAYPIAHARADRPWDELAALLNETIIRRVLQKDFQVQAVGIERNDLLLEEVFRLACRYAGQAPGQALYQRELKTAMNLDSLKWQTILGYLKFLDGTLLLRLVAPVELRLKRAIGAGKLCLCDHALRAAWMQEIIPLDPIALERQPHTRDLAGHIAESAAGYFMKSISDLELSHFPERTTEPEVDFVLTVGYQRIPMEIKYQSRITWDDTRGLRSFIDKSVYNAPFGILITQLDDVVVDDPRIVCLPLSSLLLMR